MNLSVLIELARDSLDEHSCPGRSPPPPALLGARELHILPTDQDKIPETALIIQELKWPSRSD